MIRFVLETIEYSFYELLFVNWKNSTEILNACQGGKIIICQLVDILIGGIKHPLDRCFQEGAYFYKADD
jgi:hypothetical protein